MGSARSKNRTPESSSRKVIRANPQEIEQWLQAADDANAYEADTIPDGWYSMKELAAMFGKSLSTTSRKVTAMVTNGTADAKSFRMRCRGNLKVVPHYRLKEKLG